MGLEYASAQELGPLALATVCYLALYYCFLYAQSYSKIWIVQRNRGRAGSLQHWDVKYTDAAVAKVKYAAVPEDPIALVLDRTVGNTLEQAIPFLTATWLHAALVPGGAGTSALLAWGYVLSRAAYPLCFWFGHPYLQLATCPGYWIIWYQLAALGWSAMSA